MAKKQCFIYHHNTILTMDIKQLVQAAKEVGHDEIPVGGGNNSEVAEVCKAIFAANPAKFFRSQDLSKLLNENDVAVTKIGNVLFAMKNSKQCSQVRKGVYISYDAKYDANITTKPVKEEGA